MRTRSLKPGFFKNEDLAACPPIARLLFAGLWLIADCQGRLKDRPARIKAEILPYDACNADELLAQLAARGFIVRYKVGDNRFIQIPAFVAHQNPHPNEKPQSIPAPEDGEVIFFPDGSHQFQSSQAIPSDHSSFRSLSPEGMPAKPGHDEKRDTSPAERPDKARDELFDVLAEVTASDPSIHGSLIGRTKSKLLSAKPPYGPDDVRKLVQLQATELAWVKGRLSLRLIEEHIGKVRAKPAGGKHASKRFPE